MPYTIVQFTTHASDGDTMHRLTWPMQGLASLPEFRVIDVHYMSPYTYRLAFDADLLVLGMTQDTELVPIVRWRKAKGKPTIFEPDNYIFELDPWNSKFENWNNPVSQVGCISMMTLVDLVQASTPFLARAFKPYSSRVAVFPNHLGSVPDGLPPKPDQPLVVGWGGSPSHIADIACIAPALSRWITDHDDVILAIMGTEETPHLFAVPQGKKRFVPPGDMEAYGEFLKGLHIGLAPLRDTPFNRGRSDVKWLEYAANGCVFAGQRLETYTNSVEDGKTGFLFDTTSELIRILDKLYTDRTLMESVRRAAFEHVTTHRRHDDHIRDRADVYREFLDRKPPDGAERWNLHQLAAVPTVNLPDPLPDYLPLRLETDEESALRALYSGWVDVSEASISLVEERYGEFHLTCHARARVAFAQGDAASAERHLRRSLSLYPAAIESLRLLGEVLLAMRRVEEARDILSLAVQWYPACMPAYRHLVDIAERESDWEAALRITHEWEKNCNQDPWARMRRGLVLIRAGRAHEGMDTMSDALTRFKSQLSYWQIPFAAELVQILRQADPLMSNEPQWSELILKADEMFPHGLWLAARAGAICLERGDYQRGARILQRARDQLLAWEWRRMEGFAAPQPYRAAIEVHRSACEELAK